MKTDAGVYALTHKITNQIYIGSSKNLKRRRQQWQQKMNNDQQNLPPAMQSITTSWHDWTFTILWDGTGATSEQLKQHELEALNILKQRAPSRVLNILPIQRSHTNPLVVNGRAQSINAWSRETGIHRVTLAARVQQLGWTPEQAVGLVPKPIRDYKVEALERAFTLARVIVLDGTLPLTRRQAADRLGCTRDTLSARLQRYQVVEGQAQVQLSELLALSQKYRRK